MFIVSDSAGGESNERLLFPKDVQAELNMTNIRCVEYTAVVQCVIYRLRHIVWQPEFWPFLALKQPDEIFEEWIFQVNTQCDDKPVSLNM